MEPLTILLQPKSYLNHVLYNLITAYLYTASICLFKYLIICRPSKTSYPTFTPQSASITNFPLPIHETLVCFTNAGKTFTTVLAERPFRMTASLTQTVPHRCTCWRQSSINKSLSGPFAAGAYMSTPLVMSTWLNVAVLHLCFLDWIALSLIRFENVQSLT